jgi:hypothetical protein
MARVMRPSQYRRRSRLQGRVKTIGSLLPEGEALRRAVAWLAEQPRRDLWAIDEASRRFDLSPLDEAFLLEHFRDDAARRTAS